MTVAEQLAELEGRRRELRSILCVGCGHEYADHSGMGGGRWFVPQCRPYREVGRGKWRAVRCGCVRFVDPPVVLPF